MSIIKCTKKKFKITIAIFYGCAKFALSKTNKALKVDKLLRMAMAEKNINGKQLAKMAGVSEKSVSIARNGGGSLKSISKMFGAMGFELKYVSK